MSHSVIFLSGTKDGCAFGINPKYISFWMVTDGFLVICVVGCSEIFQFKLPENQNLLDVLVDKSVELNDN